MSIETSEYVNVRARAEELGCILPDGLALLPSNFDTASMKSDLVTSSNTATLRSLLRQEGFGDPRIDSVEEPIPEDSKKFIEWIGPIIFIGAGLYGRNPYVVAVVLNVVSNYLTDFFKGLPGKHDVSIDVVVEHTKDGDFSYDKYSYHGPKDGLKDMAAFVKETSQ